MGVIDRRSLLRLAASGLVVAGAGPGMLAACGTTRSAGPRTTDFADWRRALARGGPKLLALGDSIVWGVSGGGTTPPGPGGSSWPSVLQALLVADHRPAVIGLAVPTTTVPIPDPRWAAPGWTQRSNGMAGGFAASCSWVGASGVEPLTFTPGTGCDRFDVFTTTAPSLGSLQARIGTGASTAIVGDAAPGVRRTTVTAPAVATHHVLALGPIAGGAVEVLAVEPSLSTSAAIRVGNAGASGTTAVQWADPRSLATIAAFAPDLAIVALGGVNDGVARSSFADYQAAVRAVVGECRKSGDVLVMTAVPSRPAAGAAYTDFEAQAAGWLPTLVGPGVGLVDIYRRWSSPGSVVAHYADDVHPDATGYADIALAAFEVIRAVS